MLSELSQVLRGSCHLFGMHHAAFATVGVTGAGRRLLCSSLVCELRDILRERSKQRTSLFEHSLT